MSGSAARGTGEPLVDFTWRRFRITTANSPAEVAEAKALRWTVFRHEWQGCPEPDGIDEDEFDVSADHLLLRDAETDLLVGTYRCMRGVIASDFYSSTEFHIENFVQLPGVKVELGRACLRPDWRSNLSMIGLFNGICAYMAAVDASYLFGCSSIDSVAIEDIVRLCRWFQRQELQITDETIEPVLEHRIRALDEPVRWRGRWSEADEARVQELMPPLLRSYLKAGARVSQRPIIDHEFECTDFFTILDLRTATIGFLDRYRQSD